MNEYEKFTGKIWKINESLVITIPRTVAKFGGYKAGDEAKVMTQKITEEE